MNENGIVNMFGGGGAETLVMPLLHQILGGSYQPGQGQPLAEQGLSTIMGMVMPGNNMAQVLSSALGPSLNRAIFGHGPFAGYGGIGSQWNAASRFMDFERERMASTFYNDSAAVTRKAAETQFINMVQGRGEGGEDYARQRIQDNDLRYLAIRGAQGLTGAGNLQRGIRDSATAFGYSFGAGQIDPGGESHLSNMRVLREMKEMGGRLTEAFASSPGDFGNLSRGAAGDVFKYMARRGEIRMGDRDYEAKVKSASVSMSAIRDILAGGPIEQAQQLEAAFGTQAVTTHGLAKSARSLNEMRMLSQATGTSLMDMVQYNQAAGMISKQLTGEAGGTMAQGMMIGSVMGAQTQFAKGTDPAEFTRTATVRGMGAALSDPAMMVNALMSGASESQREAIRAGLDREVAGSRGPLTGEAISRIGREAGVNMSPDQLLYASRTQTAKDYGATDSTGARAVWKANINVIRGARKTIVKGILGPDYEEGMEDLESRELDKKLGPSRSDKAGMINDAYKFLHGAMGYSNPDDVPSLLKRLPLSERRQREAELAAEMGEKYTSGGGGIGAIVRAFGYGDAIAKANTGDIVRVGMGMASEKQLKGLKAQNEKALGARFRGALESLAGPKADEEGVWAERNKGKDTSHEAYLKYKRGHEAQFNAHASQYMEALVEEASKDPRASADTLANRVGSKFDRNSMESASREELYRQTGKADMSEATYKERGAATYEALKKKIDLSKYGTEKQRKEIADAEAEDKRNNNTKKMDELRSSGKLGAILDENKEAVIAEYKAKLEKDTKPLGNKGEHTKDQQKKIDDEVALFKESVQDLKGSASDQVMDMFRELVTNVVEACKSFMEGKSGERANGTPNAGGR